MAVGMVAARLIAPVLPYSGEIAYTAHDPNRLVLFDVAHAIPYTLHHGNTTFLNPHWSRDGNQLLANVIDTAPQEPQTQLMLIDFLAAHIQPLLPTQNGSSVINRAFPAQLSPDGHYLAYVVYSRELVWVDQTGSQRTHQAPRDVSTFIWTPNNHLRYAVVDSIDAASFQLSVTDVYTSGTAEPVGSWVFPRTWVSPPIFSPNGERLLFWNESTNRAEYQLMVYDLMTGDNTVVGATTYWNGNLAVWAMDSEQIAFTMTEFVNVLGNVQHIMLSSATDPDPRIIHTYGRDDHFRQYAWSPDNSQLAFIGWRAGFGESLCLVDMADYSVACPLALQRPFGQFAWRPR